MSDEKSTFDDGDELLFHLSSLGASVVPLPMKVMEETGAAATMELNMMHGLYRGETDTHWIVDVTSVDPPVRSCRLLKVGVDFIGVKTTIDVIRRRIHKRS